MSIINKASVWSLLLLAGAALVLSACGGSGSSVTGGESVTASQFAKLAAGNKWVTETATTNTSKIGNNTPTTTTTNETNTTVLGAVAASGVQVTRTSVNTTTNTNRPTSINFVKLDAAGNLIDKDKDIILPASMAVGTTWTIVLDGISATLKVTGVNTSQTVAGLGTFNDVLVVSVTISGSLGGVLTDIMATDYYSRAVGSVVPIQSTSTVSSSGSQTDNGVTTTVKFTGKSTSVLKPGYIAN